MVVYGQGAVWWNGGVHGLEDWLAGATTCETLVTPDGKSGAVLERLVVDGEAYVLKHIRAEDDWIMRVTGDDGTWFLSLWTSGTLARLPPVVDTVVVDVFAQPGGSAILMHDVSYWMVLGGDAPSTSASTVASSVIWRRCTPSTGTGTTPSACWTSSGATPGSRPRRCDPRRPDRNPPSSRLAVTGWERLPEVAPRMAEQLFALHDDPTSRSSRPARPGRRRWSTGT